MKAHLIQVLVIDHEDHGIEDAMINLQQGCEYSSIIETKTADIGDWDDDHPLNSFDTKLEGIKKYFNG